MIKSAILKVLGLWFAAFVSIYLTRMVIHTCCEVNKDNFKRKKIKKLHFLFVAQLEGRIDKDGVIFPFLWLQIFGYLFALFELTVGMVVILLVSDNVAGIFLACTVSVPFLISTLLPESPHSRR